MNKGKSWPVRANVIGNGPGVGEVTVPGLMVRFNRSYRDGSLSEGASVLWVNNLHHKGCGLGFFSEGSYASGALDNNLQAKALALSGDIECWPSSGLTTVSLLAGKIQCLRVFQMPLLPSLLRSTGLHPKKPLACAFHNWLGERRFALLSKTGITPWPSLFLANLGGGRTISGNLFQDLLSLPKMSRDGGSKLLKQLGLASTACWLANATPQLLKAAEHLFYLNRQVDQTPNWWLYDYDGSARVEVIRRRLAWCQQELLCS